MGIILSRNGGEMKNLAELGIFHEILRPAAAE